ncbi:MAG: excinuclease ABC subunit UvrB [Candidatus Moraniibacteriota bacterium]
MSVFSLTSPYQPAGDQPKAIEGLVSGLQEGIARQTLLGVTGSGKTFTAANVIQAYDKPTLVIAHNKTLAAQLAQEYQTFFPDNAVHYFVSYYDYYQPEAYLPITDTYIEKDAQINAEIDRLRHASTQSLLTRKDVIIVASVSAIYGLGSPEEYMKNHLLLEVGEACSRPELLRKLVSIFFTRTNADLLPGTFRALGNRIEIMPVSEKTVYMVELAGSNISEITKIDPVTQRIQGSPKSVYLFPTKHFVADKDEQERAIGNIRAELAEQLNYFEKTGKLLEAERLKRRTNYDLAMMAEIGYCNGIENYSRQLSFRPAGAPPETLLDYFPHLPDGTPDFLTIIDESHVTLPQIRGMYAGDQARKKNLVEFGFRLPSALDNRPLRYEEFDERVGAVVYTSATPGAYERESSGRIVEQVIRPTGLIDPEISVRPVRESTSGEFERVTHPSVPKTGQLPSKRGAGKRVIGLGAGPRGGKKETEDAEGNFYPGQVGDFIRETELEVGRGGRVLATTLTKKMAEDLSQYLKERGIRAEYLHSDIKTIDRIKILTQFRKGEFDCLVGVNLLREGLDLPEVSFIGILDADKEGFLRSETSLIQIIGRAARNVAGRVTLYADKVTGSMRYAIDETNRRRAIQIAHNEANGITPETILKTIHDITEDLESEHDKAVRSILAIDEVGFDKDPRKTIRRKEKEMKEAVKILDFETAAILRDEIRALEARETRNGK